MELFQKALCICERGIRHLIHHPVSLVFTLFGPLVWFLLFGSALKEVARFPGFPAPSYFAFITGGVLGILILSGNLFNASNVIFDKFSGYFAKLLSFPISRVAIALGYAMDALVQSIVMVLILLGVAWLIGVHITAGWIGVLLIILFSLLLGFGITCLGLNIALSVPTVWAFFGMVSFIELPLIFMSSAFFPREFMPGWLKTVALFNPLTYYIEPVRDMIVNGVNLSSIGWGIMGLLIFDLLMFALISISFKRTVAV